MEERLVKTRELFQPAQLNIVQEAYDKAVLELKARGVDVATSEIAKIVFLFASSTYVELERLREMVLKSFKPVQ